MGGPSAGKSKALDALKTAFEQEGKKVYTIKEISSEVLESGVDVDSFGRYAFQKLIFDLQKHKEDLYYTLLQEKEGILIQDRCLYDHLGYLKPDEWAKLLEEEKMDLADLEKRYEEIYFLDSAALIGKYDQKSNPVRMEDGEEAILSNAQLKKAAFHFKNTKLIEAKPTFEEKFNALIEQIKTSEH